MSISNSFEKPAGHHQVERISGAVHAERTFARGKGSMRDAVKWGEDIIALY